MASTTSPAAPTARGTASPPSSSVRRGLRATRPPVQPRSARAPRRGPRTRFSAPSAATRSSCRTGARAWPITYLTWRCWDQAPRHRRGRVYWVDVCAVALEARPDVEVVVLDKLTYAGRRENLAGVEDRIEF